LGREHASNKRHNKPWNVRILVIFSVLDAFEEGQWLRLLLRRQGCERVSEREVNVLSLESRVEVVCSLEPQPYKQYDRMYIFSVDFLVAKSVELRTFSIWELVTYIHIQQCRHTINIVYTSYSAKHLPGSLYGTAKLKYSMIHTVRRPM
jgi:hypothetical protein